MAVPEMHPQSLVLRRRSHDRQHVGHAGANAAPGFGLDRSAEINQPARRLLGAIELARLRQPFRSSINSAPDVIRNPFAIGAMAYAAQDRAAAD